MTVQSSLNHSDGLRVENSVNIAIHVITAAIEEVRKKNLLHNDPYISKIMNNTNCMLNILKNCGYEEKSNELSGWSETLKAIYEAGDTSEKVQEIIKNGTSSAEAFFQKALS